MPNHTRVSPSVPRPPRDSGRPVPAPRGAAGASGGLFPPPGRSPLRRRGRGRAALPGREPPGGGAGPPAGVGRGARALGRERGGARPPCRVTIGQRLLPAASRCDAGRVPRSPLGEPVLASAQCGAGIGGRRRRHGEGGRWRVGGARRPQEPAMGRRARR